MSPSFPNNHCGDDDHDYQNGKNEAGQKVRGEIELGGDGCDCERY